MYVEYERGILEWSSVQAAEPSQLYVIGCAACAESVVSSRLCRGSLSSIERMTVDVTGELRGRDAGSARGRQHRRHARLPQQGADPATGEIGRASCRERV